jgi:hypothetical protein
MTLTGAYYWRRLAGRAEFGLQFPEPEIANLVLDSSRYLNPTLTHKRSYLG